MIRSVKKGKFRFTPPGWGLHLGMKMQRKVMFYPSCKYDQGDDWNKLYGKAPITLRSIGELFIRILKWIKPSWFKWLKVPHHKESHRIAWRCLNDEIQIAAYWYKNGVRHHYKFSVARTLESQNSYIEGRKGKVYFYHHNSMYVIPGKWPWFGYKLSTVFGGNDPATHNMQIEFQ